MAKRAAPDEKPYRPLLEAELVRAALSHVAPAGSGSRSAPAPQATSAKIVDIPRADMPRRPEIAPDVGRATAESTFASSETESPSPAVQAVVEKFDHEKRILFTRPESQAIDRLVISLATRLDAQVKVSHVFRAMVALLLNAEAQLDRRAGEAGPLVRPANGDAQGLQRFEREIGRIIASALRDAGPLK
jgi:hypothetical protein